MLKLAKFSLIFSLLFNNVAIANNNRVMAGIKFTANGSDIYLKYKEQESGYEEYNSFINNKQNIEIELTGTELKKLRKTTLNYSNYKNVEGFKNNKKKEDRTFASIFLGFGALVVIAGAVTVNALIKAIDD